MDSKMVVEAAHSIRNRGSSWHETNCQWAYPGPGPSRSSVERLEQRKTSRSQEKASKICCLGVERIE